MTPGQAELLQNGLAGWAETEASCRALALVGSWARDAARADSDLDLIALMHDLDRWTADAGWLRNVLGKLGLTVESAGLEVYGVARSWRVSPGSGHEIELTLAGTGWASPSPLDPGSRRVVSDGMRVLVDKDGLLSAVQAAGSAPVDLG